MSTPDGVVTRYGAEALRLATMLLQRMRQTRPAGTIWEAADVQWWSRQERPTDRDGQLFWLDERGEPVAAVLATDFGHSVQHDVLTVLKDHSGQRLAWRTAIARASTSGGAGATGSWTAGGVATGGRRGRSGTRSARRTRAGAIDRNAVAGRRAGAAGIRGSSRGARTPRRWP